MSKNLPLAKQMSKLYVTAHPCVNLGGITFSKKISVYSTTTTAELTA